MVLHQPKITGSQKVANARAMKKETKRIKRSRVPKDVGASVSTPLCRSINRLGTGMEKAKNQVGYKDKNGIERVNIKIYCCFLRYLFPF